jgi:prepilin-type N-terminal cleavage/methylation domain-containing protein
MNCQKTFCSYASTGFTLAELLIALAILGVIATFSIPKVLQSQNDTKRKAVFKETMATIVATLYAGSQNGMLQNSAAVTPFYMDNINAVKTCPNSALAEGCWTGPPDIGEAGEPGLKLANGAEICSLNGDDNGDGNISADFVIDWNGPNAPNQVGEDRIYMVMCISGSDCGGTFFWIPPSLRVGKFAAVPDGAVGGVANEALYSQIFQ